MLCVVFDVHALSNNEWPLRETTVLLDISCVLSWESGNFEVPRSRKKRGVGRKGGGTEGEVFFELQKRQMIRRRDSSPTSAETRPRVQGSSTATSPGPERSRCDLIPLEWTSPCRFTANVGVFCRLKDLVLRRGSTPKRLCRSNKVRCV